jgi:hypothetical protein
MIKQKQKMGGTPYTTPFYIFVQESIQIINSLRNEYFNEFKNKYNMDLLTKCEVDEKNNCILVTVFLKDKLLAPWVDETSHEDMEFSVPVVKIVAGGDVSTVKDAIMQLFYEVHNLQHL